MPSINKEKWIIYYEIENVLKYHRLIMPEPPKLIALGAYMYELVWINYDKRIAKYKIKLMQ